MKFTMEQAKENPEKSESANFIINHQNLAKNFKPIEANLGSVLEVVNWLNTAAPSYSKDKEEDLPVLIKQKVLQHLKYDELKKHVGDLTEDKMHLLEQVSKLEARFRKQRQEMDNLREQLEREKWERCNADVTVQQMTKGVQALICNIGMLIGNLPESVNENSTQSKKLNFLDIYGEPMILSGSCNDYNDIQQKLEKLSSGVQREIKKSADKQKSMSEELSKMREICGHVIIKLKGSNNLKSDTICKNCKNGVNAKTESQVEVDVVAAGEKPTPMDVDVPENIVHDDHNNSEKSLTTEMPVLIKVEKSSQTKPTYAAVARANISSTLSESSHKSTDTSLSIFRRASMELHLNPPKLPHPPKTRKLITTTIPPASVTSETTTSANPTATVTSETTTSATPTTITPEVTKAPPPHSQPPPPSTPPPTRPPAPQFSPFSTPSFPLTSAFLQVQVPPSQYSRPFKIKKTGNSSAPRQIFSHRPKAIKRLHHHKNNNSSNKTQPKHKITPKSTNNTKGSSNNVIWRSIPLVDKDRKKSGGTKLVLSKVCNVNIKTIEY